jgi:nucleotide-binding universal stress UspA family protein
MIVVLAVLLVLAGAAGGAVAGWIARSRRGDGRARVAEAPGQRRILLPFTGAEISRRALEAAMRLARAEGATIMPAYLAKVPRTLPLDAALPNQCLGAMPLLEAIEQRVAATGIAVDARVSRGRTYRDALRHLLDEEHVDRVIVPATPGTGLTPQDIDWLLHEVPAEVLILRPDPRDHRALTAGAAAGHP